MPEQQDLAFQLFKVAQEKYGEAIDKLEKPQYDDALRIAQRKIRIEEAVLSSSAAAKVSVPANQIDEALEQIRGRYEEESDFYTDIQRVGIDETFFYQALSRELHVEAILDFISSDCDGVTETEISLYYYMNVAKFHMPEVRTARHILVTINEDNVENSRANSLKKINQIASRLGKKPDRFSEQALKHSECPTSLQGGLMGKVKPGVLYPEIEQALFALKVGELSEVVESPLGFHIVLCEEIQQEGTVPLQDVYPRLEEFLQNRKRKQRQRQWLESILTSSNDSHYENGEAANG
ncbi:nitrogen fixation protein NifM [Teredinibacter turnerae]|uniref:nitrogen fixation protein NifM n=1 Tax=Teredinibacter turnerae TaxID=2426 RepID=UPI00036CF975|nr:nitrogen fixation protein NifM [Teredinibacter turnerae]